MLTHSIIWWKPIAQTPCNLMDLSCVKTDMFYDTSSGKMRMQRKKFSENDKQELIHFTYFWTYMLHHVYICYTWLQKLSYYHYRNIVSDIVLNWYSKKIIQIVCFKHVVSLLIYHHFCTKEMLQTLFLLQKCNYITRP